MAKLSNKERNLIKGAIRRVFSRSELRQAVVRKSITTHTDLTRPRVKTWCICPECKKYTPKSYMQVDHVIPIIHLSETLEDISWDTLIDRLWCAESNLVAICTECHKAKSKAENKERPKLRRPNVKRRKKNTVSRRNSRR